MAVTYAVGVALWTFHPRLRPLWAIAVLAVAIGLFGASCHFLSDVIAGSFVGLSAGWMARAFCELRASARLSNK
jgi:hypothetical protein